MSDIARKRCAVVDAFVQLGVDIIAAPDDASMQRLRSATASALQAQLHGHSAIPALSGSPAHPARMVSDEARVALLEDLDALKASGAHATGALLLVRRDERDVLSSGTLVDSLSALVPGERLGPFTTHGGLDVWFDVFFAAHRLEVRETGSSAPAIVVTQAQPPVIGLSSTTIFFDPGTVWVRGDLVDGALPAGAFVGIKVRGGALQLDQQARASGNVVEVAAPLTGVLELHLAEDAVTPVAGGCASAAARVTLPDFLRFTFAGGTAIVDGAAGKAEVWAQQFEFGPSTGTWTFLERLWTVVLGYDVEPRRFDADPIRDELVHFEGRGEVQGAGLGLPVVVAGDPAILGEVAFAASWFLRVSELLARWYVPDERLHALQAVWIGISGLGASILAEDVAPLAPAVTHGYGLWNISGSDRRLPWRQIYDAPFVLFYRCNVVEGEYFMALGRAEVALDRPVTTSGVPVAVPATRGSVLLHDFGGTITALLAALGEDARAANQFALRNALVWTGAPVLPFARGTLTGPAQIDDGIAQLSFGVHAWGPTLPDPYVSNVFLRRPQPEGVPSGFLVATVSWTAPEQVAVSFAGQLGTGLAVGGREASTGAPRPARPSDGDPDIGPTQAGQGRLTLDERTAAAWSQAQATEQGQRDIRAELAQQVNSSSEASIDGFMTEVTGPAPGLLLLDVSTSQDLLGVAFGARRDGEPGGPLSPASSFPVTGMAAHSEVAGMRVIALPQVQWEPVRTLDSDQDIMTMGWFPTPLASAHDGGATQIGARSQTLMPIIPEDALQGTFDAYRDGRLVGMRTTFPFGLIGAILLQPRGTPQRQPDLYALTRPEFPAERAVGGIQVTAHAEGGRADDGRISPAFAGRMQQLLNGVDLPSGAPLGLSVLGSTADPAGSVETLFNADMAARPRVPVTRIDISGYGGSSFSEWNDPFGAFAEAAKVQFRVMIGRTALEVVKVNSVWHPWGVRVTRSVTIERRPGGGVIRRDSGWEAFTPGIFDYRYFDPDIGDIAVAPYAFDAGVFRGLFQVRNFRPAPGAAFFHGDAELVPYYADAEVALEGVPGRAAAAGVLGYLQTAPIGRPAEPAAIQALIEAQGPIGGPVEAWMNFGSSGLPFRVQRVEVGLALDGANPLFVATVRGVPSLPRTGAWSVVRCQVAGVPPNGGEALPVAEDRGVPVIRRYPVRFLAGDATPYPEPRLDPSGPAPGDYRFSDAGDLLIPDTPASDYALLQSTPTHAFLFPRPFVPAATAPRIETAARPALADIFARSTSKGAFPPPGNTIELAPGAVHFDVGAQGSLALSPPVSIAGHPTPLRLAGTPGHGSSLFYDRATMRLALEPDRWEAEFTGLYIWSDVAGLERVTGSEMHLAGATEQRPQIAELASLVLQEIEDILRFIPLFAARGAQGPVELGATNARHELKVDITLVATLPPPALSAIFPAGTDAKLTLSVRQRTGIDMATAGAQASAAFGAAFEGKFPVLSIEVAAAFVVVSGEITFSLTSVNGSVTAEKLDLAAFVGLGVEGKVGPFKAYQFLGIGFELVHDIMTNQTKYGGLVAFEAGVETGVVGVKVRAELKGLVYHDRGVTKCDYSGAVKLEVDIFLVISISATYQISETTTL